MSKIETIKLEAIKKGMEYNAAIAANDMQAKGSALAALKEAEKEFKKASFDEFIKMIRETENPVLTAIKTLQYEVLKHKEMRDGAVETGIELYITDEKVSMSKVFERLGISNIWSSYAAKLNYMYTLRAALDQGIEGEEFQKIKTNYMIADEVKSALEGKTPTSNTQMIPHLQNVVDAMIFVAREDGQNTYRVVGKDVNTLEKWHTSKDRRTIGGTDAAGDTAFESHVTEIIHCIVTGTGYRMTGKNINGSRAEPKHLTIALTTPDEKKAEKPAKATAKKATPKKSVKKAAEDATIESKPVAVVAKAKA